MRCTQCQYSLKGLTDNRCPECGREFDPRDRATFDADDPFRPRLLPLAVFSLIALLVLFLVIFSGLRAQPRYWAEDRFLTVIALGNAIVATVGLLVIAIPTYLTVLWYVHQRRITGAHR